MIVWFYNIRKAKKKVPTSTTMWLVNFVLAATFLASIEANYIRINNASPQSLVLINEVVGHGRSNGTLIESGDFVEIGTLNEWEGSFYTYPEECLLSPCYYPVTKVSVSFERVILDAFYDFLVVDLNQGFNVPASIKSITRPDCDVVSCSFDLLEICSDEDKVANEEGTVVACRTSEANYQRFKERCPKALVDASDVALGICASMDYEITFG